MLLFKKMNENVGAELNVTGGWQYYKCARSKYILCLIYFKCFILPKPFLKKKTK